MTPPQRFALAACAAIVLSGCGPSESDFKKLAARNYTLEQRVAVLEKQVNDELIARTKALAEAQGIVAKSIELLNGEASRIQAVLGSKLDAEEPAVVDPRDKGFSVARSQYGSFAVSIADAQPYLDGFKVRMQIGNLTYATMANVKLLVTYGPREPAVPDLKGLSLESSNEAIKAFSTTYQASRAARKAITASAGKQLAPGTWNAVEVVVSPCKAEELGRVEVFVRPEAVSLHEPAETMER